LVSGAAHAYNAKRPRSESKQNSNRAPISVQVVADDDGGGSGGNVAVVLVVVGLPKALLCTGCALCSLLCGSLCILAGSKGGKRLATTGWQTEKPTKLKNPKSVYRKRVRGAEVAARGHHNGVLDLSV